MGDTHETKSRVETLWVIEPGEQFGFADTEPLEIGDEIAIWHSGTGDYGRAVIVSVGKHGYDAVRTPGSRS